MFRDILSYCSSFSSQLVNSVQAIFCSGHIPCHTRTHRHTVDCGALFSALLRGWRAVSLQVRVSLTRLVIRSSQAGTFPSQTRMLPSSNKTICTESIWWVLYSSWLKHAKLYVAQVLVNDESHVNTNSISKPSESLPAICILVYLSVEIWFTFISQKQDRCCCM